VWEWPSEVVRGEGWRSWVIGDGLGCYIGGANSREENEVWRNRAVTMGRLIN
jgi:hypothetical protein